MLSFTDIAVVGFFIFLFIYAWHLYLKRPWTNYVYPFLINQISTRFNKATVPRKRVLFSHMKEHAEARKNGRPYRILEIGAGPGPNFDYYPEGSHLTLLEPNAHFKKYLTEKIDKYNGRLSMDFVEGYAEDLDRLFEREAFDAVVCTHVLCSVQDLERVLKNITQILVKGGKMYVLEHVADHAFSLAGIFQRIISPMWLEMVDGCRLVSYIDRDIKGAGFTKIDMKEELISNTLLPFFLYRHLIGVAEK